MPCYDGTCLTCGTVEIYKGMNDPWPLKCPRCKGNGFERIFSTQTAFHAPCDAGWESENNGLGHWMPQLGPRFKDAKTKQIPNADAYARSQADGIEKFKRKGYDDIQRY